MPIIINRRHTENRGQGESGLHEGEICEFRVRGTFPRHLQSGVVYVGSNFPRDANGIVGCRRVKSRIINYCRHGNHRADVTKDSLSRGCKLWVWDIHIKTHNRFR